MSIEQTELINAVGEHIDKLSSYTNWLLSIVSIVIIKNIQDARNKPIEILGINFQKDEVTVILDVIVSVYSLTVLILLGRIFALFNNLLEHNLSEAYEKLGTNSSIFNPFSFFGDDFEIIFSFISVFLFVSLYYFSLDLSVVIAPKKSILVFEAEKDKPSREVYSSESKFNHLDSRITQLNSILAVTIFSTINVFLCYLSSRFKIINPELSFAIFLTGIFFPIWVIFAVRICQYCNKGLLKYFEQFAEEV